jgi:hypothetical protein
MHARADRPLAWVVYESMFGSTAALAMMMAGELRGGYRVRAYEVGEAPSVVPADVELLLVGGPTHAFSMSTTESRKAANEQHDGALVSCCQGVREWLDGVTFEGAPRAAAFDTKVKPAWFWGSAARGIHGRLDKLGARMVALPESFFVSFDKDAGLLEGEVDRARAWANDVASREPIDAELRPPRALRVAGYGVLAALNLGLLVVVNNVLAWGWFDFLTEDLAEVLVWINLSLAAGVAANVLYTVHDTKRFIAGAELVQAITGTVAAAVMLSVFPFDFSSYGDVWPLVVKGGLFVGIFGSVVGVLVNGAKLVASLITGGGQGGHLSPR